ncbi:hypothetical protein [Methylomonas sp. HYX-M1]|uniref:hypothetical protein n=1 Tax=Methylomonas sp. HYX-M1 TaxID=3139307 RepID=UPI00345B5404
MSTEERNYLWQRRYEIKLRALMNRMYYLERQRLFEFREGAIKALSIVAGSVALAKVADPDILQICAALITLGSTFSLVFGYGNKARESVKLATEWTQLERDIDSAGERTFTEAQLDQWQARCSEIEAGEPPAHKLLLNRCNERAVKALGGQSDYKLNFIERILPLVLVP